MPGSAVHAETPLNVLETTLQQLYTKKITLEVEDADKHKDQLAKIDAKIDEYNAIIKTKKETIPPKTEPDATSLVAPQSANLLGNPEARFHYNSMITHFKTNVPTLEPPLDVSVFIQRLQNCYNLFVKPFKALEPYFIQSAKGQLSMDILESINASEEKTDTFEELQIYLKKHYGSRETPFQILSSLMDLEIKEGEKLQEFAGRLERKTATVVTQIAAKFQDREANTDSTPMTANDCFNLFGSMIFYDHLRNRQPNCFNLMVKEVDNCWRPSDLGSMAATLVDRLDISQPAATPQTYSARPSKQQQKTTSLQFTPAQKQTANDNNVCLRHMVFQNCPFGQRCKRKHVNPGDEEYNTILQQLHANNSQNTSQSNVTPQANVALNEKLHPDESFPAAFPSHVKSLEDLQPEEVGLDFFVTDHGLSPFQFGWGDD